MKEIQAHPFFRGVSWETLLQQRAPFTPTLKSITDTSYFPMEDLEDVPEAIPSAGAGACEPVLALSNPYRNGPNG